MTQEIESEELLALRAEIKQIQEEIEMLKKKVRKAENHDDELMQKKRLYFMQQLISKGITNY